MNETEIRKYAGLMQELGLTGLEITMEHGKVRLERSLPQATVETVLPLGGPAAAMLTAQGTDGTQGQISTAAADSNTISVTSPIVGVFYAAPAENAEPYVKVGDPVSKGQMLCIIEAMKLMNEIASDYEGTIAEICVTDGQVVEYGTELFRIRR